MYYLYENNRLKALRMTPEAAIGIARFCNAILVTNRIEEAILIADYPKSALLIHSKNIFTLFSYWKLQIRYKTLSEFRIILFAAPRNLLYRFLAAVAWISLGAYHLIPFYRRKQ